MKLIWNKWNREHIKKHDVNIVEVEEVYKNPLYQQKTYENRVMIFGKTKQDRLLTIVCLQENQKDFYIVSARDMSKKERRILHEQTKTY